LQWFLLTSRVFPFCNFVSLLGYNLESDGGKTTKQIRAEAKKAAAEKKAADDAARKDSAAEGEFIQLMKYLFPPLI
jgi:hypothetical protein